MRRIVHFWIAALLLLPTASAVHALDREASVGSGGLQLAQASGLVLDLQRELTGLGYQPGPADGRIGARTRDAIRSYQRDHGLLVDGQPSGALLDHMRLRVAEQPHVQAADADTIAGIQAELRRRGYAIPAVTGRVDAETRESIRDYQRGIGVAATGEASRALLDEMRSAGADEAPEAGLTREQRAAAQRALNVRGYNAGPPDGVLGPLSRVAVRTFQADNGLDPTGQLTPRTLELLQIAAADPAPVPTPPAPEYRLRLRDDFADGDYTRNPAWRIASGRFEVRDGGLFSSIPEPSTRPEDIGRQLLGGILQQQLGVPIPGQPTAAAAYVPVRVSPVFQAYLDLSGAAQAHAHFDVGLFMGQELGSGYRLVYRSGQARPLQLVFVDAAGGRSVLGSSTIRLDDGGLHRLSWARGEDGRVTVRHGADGTFLIDMVDRSHAASDFDGFSFVSTGGEWTLHEVVVEHRE